MMLRQKKQKQIQMQKEQYQKDLQLISDKKRHEKEAKEKEALEFNAKVCEEMKAVQEQEKCIIAKKQEVAIAYGSELSQQAQHKKVQPKKEGEIETGLNFESYKKQKVKF